MKKNLGRFYLLIVAILWGSSLTVVKSAQAVFKPNMLLAFRFSIACIILSIIFYKKIKNMTREDLKSGTMIGIVLFLAYSVQTIGVGYTDPGRSAFLSASYCVIVPFISWLVIKHKPNRFHVIAAVFCIIGIYFVSVFGESSKAVGNNAILGDGLALLSGVLFASHIVAVTKFSEGRDPILMTIIQFLVAAVLAVITSLLFEDNFPIVFEKKSSLRVNILIVNVYNYSITSTKHRSIHRGRIELRSDFIFGICIWNFNSLLFGDRMYQLIFIVWFYDDLCFNYNI